jgi:hypothetical protein
MVMNPTPDVRQAPGSSHNDVDSASELRSQVTTWQVLQGFDAQVSRASHQTPFQFARWLAALLTVIVGWLVMGTQQSVTAYVPTLAVVAVLLLPDAQSIAVAGLKFDRLRDEVASQHEEISRLRAEIMSINSSIASSQVHIAFGTMGTDTARTAEARLSGGPDQTAAPEVVAQRTCADQEPRVSRDGENL